VNVDGKGLPMNALAWLRTACLPLAALPCTLFAAAAAAPAVERGRPTPAILDTDIGDDIDDTWALVMALRSPELDMKLVVGDYGKPEYRARIIAKLLETAGRTDVGVGLGSGTEGGPNERQSAWIADYDLGRYPGKVHRDGVQAIIDTILASPEPVTLICIGPLPNVAEALRREPRIATRARFVGMHGSVRLGYGGATTPAAEWNVRANPAACRACLTAPWDVTITPLDTCGLVRLAGAQYAAVRDCKDPLAQALVANYRVWCQANGHPGEADSASSILFDTAAVYLAFAQDLCTMEPLHVRVDDDGFTREDPQGKAMNVATAWRDLGAFEDLLVRRVTGGR